MSAERNLLNSDLNGFVAAPSCLPDRPVDETAGIANRPRLMGAKRHPSADQ